MPEKKLVCKTCGRKFGMPAHLARHTNSAHGTGGGRKRGRPKGSGKSRFEGIFAKRGPGRPPSLGSATRAIRELKAYLNQLNARRGELDAEMEIVEDALRAMGAPRGRGRRR